MQFSRFDEQGSSLLKEVFISEMESATVSSWNLHVRSLFGTYSFLVGVDENPVPLIVDQLFLPLFVEDIKAGDSIYSHKPDAYRALAGILFEARYGCQVLLSTIEAASPEFEKLETFVKQAKTKGDAVSFLSQEHDEFPLWSSVIRVYEAFFHSYQVGDEGVHKHIGGLVRKSMAEGKATFEMVLFWLKQSIKKNIVFFGQALEGFERDHSYSMNDVDYPSGDRVCPIIDNSTGMGRMVHKGKQIVSCESSKRAEVVRTTRREQLSSFPLVLPFNASVSFLMWFLLLSSSYSMGCVVSGPAFQGMSPCTGSEVGEPHFVDVYAVNGSICVPDSSTVQFTVLTPLEAAEFHCGSMSSRYWNYLVANNSTWICGSQANGTTPEVPGPSSPTTGPYAGWSTDFQASTGPHWGQPRLCPPKFQQLIGTPESSWPFLGSSSYLLCGGHSRTPFQRNSVNGPRTVGYGYFQTKPYYTVPWYLGLGAPTPTSLENGVHPEVNDIYTWTTSGCFDGYSSIQNCIAGTGATTCYQVNAPDSVETDSSLAMNSMVGSDGPRFCPVNPSAVDPIVCYQAGEVDPECMLVQMSGALVNGSEAYCLNNNCNLLSNCWCAYVTGREVALCGADEAVVSRVNYLNIQTLTGWRDTSARSLRTGLMFLNWDQPNMRVSFTTEGLRILLIQKNGLAYTRTCHGVSCSFEMDVDFYSTSGWAYVTSSVESGVESSSKAWVEAATWCKQYKSIWRVYPDWNCLSDAQKAFAVGVLLLLFALVVIAIPPLMMAVMAVFRMSWACLRFCYRSSRSSPVSVTVQNYIRGAYRGILPTLLMASMVMACQQGPALQGTSPVCVTSDGVSQCTSSFSGLFQVNSMGETYCWTAGDDIGFELSYLYTMQIAQTSFMYHTSDWTMKQSTKFRCNQASCDASTCTRVDAEKSSNPNGQLSDMEVIEHTGQSGCFSVNDSVQSSILNGCSGLNPNCLYWKSSILPQGDDIEVYKVSSFMNVPVFNLTVTSDESVTTTTIYVDGPTDIMGFTISPDVRTFDRVVQGDGCMVKRGANTYYTPCSRVSYPEAGLIGDIQSNFNLKNDSTAPILYDPRIYLSVETHSKDITVRYVKSTVKDTLTGKNQLPMQTSKGVWFMTNGTMMGLTDGTSFSVFVTGDEFNYTRLVENPCPVIDSVSCSGCYSCISGGAVRVSAHSSCIEGVAELTVNSGVVNRKSVRLSQTQSEYEVKFTTGEQEIDVSVCISGVCESVTCNLSEVKTLDDGKEILVVDNSAKDAEESPTRWLEDMFNGVGSWWQWLLVILMIVAGLAVLVMISPMIIKTMLTYLRKEKVVKKVVVEKDIEMPRKPSVRKRTFVTQGTANATVKPTWWK